LYKRWALRGIRKLWELETLSIASKSAYVTGLWDGYIFFSRN